MSHSQYTAKSLMCNLLSSTTEIFPWWCSGWIRTEPSVMLNHGFGTLFTHICTSSQASDFPLLEQTSFCWQALCWITNRQEYQALLHTDSPFPSSSDSFFVLCLMGDHYERRAQKQSKERRVALNGMKGHGVCPRRQFYSPVARIEQYYLYSNLREVLFHRNLYNIVSIFNYTLSYNESVTTFI